MHPLDYVWRVGRVGEAWAPATKGRWHDIGDVVYAAMDPTGALLEHLAHRTSGDAMTSLQVVRVKVPHEASMNMLLDTSLPGHWRDDLALTRHLGNRWRADGQTGMLMVPSALVPHGCNLLLNPRHRDWADVSIDVFPFRLDGRLRASSYREHG